MVSIANTIVDPRTYVNTNEWITRTRKQNENTAGSSHALNNRTRSLHVVLDQSSRTVAMAPDAHTSEEVIDASRAHVSSRVCQEKNIRVHMTSFCSTRSRTDRVRCETLTVMIVPHDAFLAYFTMVGTRRFHHTTLRTLRISWFFSLRWFPSQIDYEAWRCVRR